MSLSLNAHRLASRLRPRSRRHYVSWFVAAVLVVVGTGWWFLGRADGAGTQAAVVTVATGTVQQTVSASGTVASARQADLDFAVSGRISDVDVKAGDEVSKGDVLATLDTVSLTASLASAKAQLEAADTTVANDGDETSTQRASNEASLASAEADVAQAQDDLDAATLRATFSGVVASVDIAVGDQAGSSSSSGSSASSTAGSTPSGATTGTTGAATSAESTAAVTIVKPTTFVVDANVAATDISEVKEGLQVKITPAGATDAIFGTVKEVGLVAETGTSGAATFPVTVAVTGPQTDLYAGTTADVSIVVKQVQDALTVPSLALTTSGGKTYVTQVTGSSTRRTAVTVGETYGMSTEITKGLVAGDKIKIAVPGRVRSGGSSSGGGQGGFPGGGFPGGGAPGGTGGFPGGAQQ